MKAKASVPTAARSSVVKFPTRAEFAEWRKKHPRTGNGGGAVSCPLAQCLKERGFDGPTVYPANYFAGDSNLPHRLPLWAQRWIEKFDAGREVKP